MKTSDLFVRCLEAEGVERVFGVPGEENEDLLFSMADAGLPFIPCRHEQGAAFIADVWGRLTGRAGVCLSTLGPGATNLLTGVADANLDKAPLVAITAQADLDRMHHESHQAIDIVQMMQPVTKWNASIPAPEVVPEAVRKAFKVAQAEKPGATHLELPESVAGLEAPDHLAPLKVREVRRPAPDCQALEAAVRHIAAAQRVLVLAGNGAIRTRASQALTSLVERFGLPVAHTFMGKGAVSDRRPESLLTIGQGFRDFVAEAVAEADLVLTVGFDIAEHDPEAWNPRGEKVVVHLDFTPAEVYVSYNPAVEVVGDLSASLEALAALMAARGLEFDRQWYRPVRQRILDHIASFEPEDEAPFTVPGVLRAVRAALPDHGLLISDVGAHKMWIARNFPTYCPNGCIISNGLASMGIAVPGAIAGSLADPSRPVIAATGDGGFLMNVQELETARRIGAGFTVVVLRDDDYGLISWKQERSAGRHHGTRIGNPDLVELGRSFGFAATRPQTRAELESALAAGVKERTPRLIDVVIDPGANDRLIRTLDRYWSEKS